MVKHRSQQKTRKYNQKGGSWFNFTWGNSDPNAPQRSWGDWWNSSTGSVENGLSNIVNTSSSFVSEGVSDLKGSVGSALGLGSNEPKTEVAPEPNQETVIVEQPIEKSQETVSQPVEELTIKETPKNVEISEQINGGKKKNMKGGKTLGLTYYASPVHGLKVAEPTFWLKPATQTKGGSKSHKKHNKNKKNNKKTRKNRKNNRKNQKKYSNKNKK